MEKTLAIVITKNGGTTTTQYIGDTSLLNDHAKTMAHDCIDGRFGY